MLQREALHGWKDEERALLLQRSQEQARLQKASGPANQRYCSHCIWHKLGLSFYSIASDASALGNCPQTASMYFEILLKEVVVTHLDMQLMRGAFAG